MHNLQKAALAAALLASAVPGLAQSQLISNRTTSHPIADGIVSPGEWDVAGSLPDGPGLAGSVYAMWREGLEYDSGTYDGKFSFLLHNIEQNTTFANGTAGQDPAYNVFDIYSADDSNNKALEVTVRYDGFTVIKYDASGGVEGSRSFTYGVDLAPEQTDDYAWDDYWGVYARGGFGNSAFDEGLDGAIDNDNQLFEVIYRSEGDFGKFRRSIKDPDQNNNWNLVEYNDVVVDNVPEPQAWALFALGLGAMGALAARRRL